MLAEQEQRFCQQVGRNHEGALSEAAERGPAFVPQQGGVRDGGAPRAACAAVPRLASLSRCCGSAARTPPRPRGTCHPHSPPPQCGTFHPLAKFAGTRRSCRDRLRKHAIRRRKTADTSRPSSWQWSEGEQEEEEEEEGEGCRQAGRKEGYRCRGACLALAQRPAPAGRAPDVQPAEPSSKGALAACRVALAVRAAHPRPCPCSPHAPCAAGSEESQRGAAEGTARRPSRSPTKRRKPGPERAGSGGSEQLPAVAPPQAATPALAVPPLLLLQPPLLQLPVQQQRALRPATPPAAAAAAANAWPWQAAWLGAEQQAAAAKPAPSPVPPRRPAIDASPGDAMAALLAAAEAEEQEEEQQRHCHRVQAAAASAAWSPAAASAAMPAGHLHQLQHQQQQDHLSSILAAFGPAAPQQQAPAPHAFIQLLAGGGGGGGSGMFGPAAAAPAAQVLLQALLSSGGLPGLCAAPAHLAGALAALQAQQAQQQVQAQLAAVCQLVLQQQLAGKAGVPPTKAQQAQPVVRPLAHHVKAEPAAAAPAGASAASPAHEHQQQTAGPHVAQPLAAVPPAAPVAA